jgi:hypothetical protein
MRINNFTRDGLMWQCPSSSCGCCPGIGARQRQSLKSGSFFMHKNLGGHHVLQGLWAILHRCSQSSITSMLGTSRFTIRKLTRDFHLLLEADLNDSDMEVGMYIHGL